MIQAESSKVNVLGELRNSKLRGHTHVIWQYAINAGKLARRRRRTSGFPEIRKIGYPEIRISGIPEIWIFGSPGIRISEIPDFRNSGFLEIRTSGIPDFRISGFPTCSSDIDSFKSPDIGRRDAEGTEPVWSSCDQPDRTSS